MWSVQRGLDRSFYANLTVLIGHNSRESRRD